jgi:hypothetical protein
MAVDSLTAELFYKFVSRIEIRIRDCHEFNNFENLADILESTDHFLTFDEYLYKIVQKLYLEYGTKDQFRWFISKYRMWYNVIDLMTFFHDIDTVPDKFCAIIEELALDPSDYCKNMLGWLGRHWRFIKCDDTKNRFMQLIKDHIIVHATDNDILTNMISCLIKIESRDLLNYLHQVCDNNQIKKVFLSLCGNNKLELAKELYEEKKHIFDTRFMKIAFEAALRGFASRIAHWINTICVFHNSDINKMMRKIHNLITNACILGDPEIIEWLIQNNVDMNRCEDIAFRTLCKFGHIDLAKMIQTKYNVNVHAKSDDAFLGAIRNNQIHILEWLLENNEFSISVIYQAVRTLAKVKNNGNTFKFLLDRELIDMYMISDELQKINKYYNQNIDMIGIIVAHFKDFVVIDNAVVFTGISLKTLLEKLIEEKKFVDVCDMIEITAYKKCMDTFDTCIICLDEKCSHMISMCRSDHFQHNICLSCFVQIYTGAEKKCVYCKKTFDVNDCTRTFLD